MTDTSGNEKDLPIEDEEKDLGIRFHSSLEFDKHVSTIVSKANQILYLIRDHSVLWISFVLETILDISSSTP